MRTCPCCKVTEEDVWFKGKQIVSYVYYSESNDYYSEDISFDFEYYYVCPNCGVMFMDTSSL